MYLPAKSNGCAKPAWPLRCCFLPSLLSTVWCSRLYMSMASTLHPCWLSPSSLPLLTPHYRRCRPRRFWCFPAVCHWHPGRPSNHSPVTYLFLRPRPEHHLLVDRPPLGWYVPTRESHFFSPILTESYLQDSCPWQLSSTGPPLFPARPL